MSESKARVVALADHPRAAGSIRRAKAAGGLAGFALATVASVVGGIPLVDALGRGLLGGVAGHLAAWVFAVTFWTVILRAEPRLAVNRALEQSREQKGAEVL